MPRQTNHDTPSAAAGVVGGLLSTASAAVGGWIGYSAFFVNHHLPLLPALDAARDQFISRYAGMLSYYHDASALGRPLVLLHSINAAGSSYEMRPLFNLFRTTRPVYSLDLPGFGFSERSDRDYTPELYAGAIVDFLNNIVGEPADVIALSLSSEFAAMAAAEYPEAINSLTLISPSGFKQRSAGGGKNNVAYGVLSFPLWSQAFYDLLTTQASIRYFLKQSFVGPVEPALAEYSYITAHQPGARYAPVHFVSGALFTPNVREKYYQHLKMPVLVIYDRDPYVRFDTLEPTARNLANWYTSRITPTRGLPHFERLPETAQALQDFWDAQDPLKAIEPSALSGWAGRDSH
jgi:pimeloyl-ACP methyl ester carboxylesterase